MGFPRAAQEGGERKQRCATRELGLLEPKWLRVMMMMVMKMMMVMMVVAKIVMVVVYMTKSCI